jgi:hypothetical protein
LEAPGEPLLVCDLKLELTPDQVAALQQRATGGR